MIEASPGGMIPILDEECIRPGEDDDRRVLMHMNKKLADHAHYSSNATGVKELQREVEFRVCKDWYVYVYEVLMWLLDKIYICYSSNFKVVIYC